MLIMPNDPFKNFIEKAQIKGLFKFKNLRNNTK